MLRATRGLVIGLCIFGVMAGDFARAQIFIETTRINSPGSSNTDHFGCNVALSGDTLAISATGYSRSRGATYLYHYDAPSWTQIARLLGSQTTKNDILGRAIGLNGDILVSGADTTKNRGIGDAYLFTGVGTHWVEQAIVTPSDALKQMGFATNVAVQGGRVVVAAPDRDSARGAVYIFELSNGVWLQTARLLPPSPAPNELFGDAVAVDGDTIAITKRYDSTQSALTGAVYIYRNSGAGWVQIAKLNAADSSLGFGNAVALQGDTLLVGAANAANGSVYGGAAFVFRETVAGWVQEARLSSTTSVQFGHFGQCVALRDGRALIGAPDCTATGAAYVFRNTGSNWSLSQQLTPIDSAAGGFGGTIALDGTRAAIGSCRTQSAWIFEEQ